MVKEGDYRGRRRKEVVGTLSWYPSVEPPVVELEANPEKVGCEVHEKCAVVSAQVILDWSLGQYQLMRGRKVVKQGGPLGVRFILPLEIVVRFSRSTRKQRTTLPGLDGWVDKTVFVPVGLHPFCSSLKGRQR